MNHKHINHFFLILLIVAGSFCQTPSAAAQSSGKSSATSLDLNTISPAKAKAAGTWKSMKGDITFLMGNDLGRNGYYDQKPIAETMGEVAEVVGPEAVIAAGDIHHFEGVASVNDPLWQTNFEWVYSHPELMLPWYPVLGNHEYRGNTQAVLDYGRVSRRWEMPGRYYTKTFEDDGVTVRLVMIDTTPLIDKYRKDSVSYPDAGRQDMQRQLAWIDSVLTVAKEDWVIVVGHHPIYAETPKSANERIDLQQRLAPILSKHHVDFYACGHIHNFQHYHRADTPIDYVVNSSGSLSRDLPTSSDQKFAANVPGFAVFSAKKNELNMYLLNKDGEILDTIKRVK